MINITEASYKLISFHFGTFGIDVDTLPGCAIPGWIGPVWIFFFGPESTFFMG
jgi:hypothetical protein